MSIMNIKQISPLEKVFLSDKDKEEFNSFSALRGEKFSYQIMYSNNEKQKSNVSVSIDSLLKDNISLFKVGNVPCETPCFDYQCDDDYITTEPGLFPDVLFPYNFEDLVVTWEKRSIWVLVDIPEDSTPGIYSIKAEFDDGENKCSVEFRLQVIGENLPKQKTIFTQWFHTDCISDYHNVDVFSDKHWELIDNYMKVAHECGINMLLTPIFTPPIDTQIGGERTTVQLIDVFKKNDGTYEFDFNKLDKWINLCKKNEIEYLEISHLFTQWGAQFSPKIIVYDNGELKRKFGWDVEGNSTDYLEFLESLMPRLIEYLEQKSIIDKVYFHVSDEPKIDKIDAYRNAAKQIAKYSDKIKVIEACSNPAFCENNLITTPVVAINKTEDFFQSSINNIWIYNCCIPAEDYSNRFMSMPSGRNRIIGIQMYKYGIEGFLHWGFNFYNSHHSIYSINPYIVTDGGNAFPGGDAFAVYPYKNGAIQSIRSRVFYDALQDIRALQLAESMVGREKIIEIIDSEGEVTFSSYSHDYNYLLRLRNKINSLIENYRNILQ